jgi:hypothetical protein
MNNLYIVKKWIDHCEKTNTIIGDQPARLHYEGGFKDGYALGLQDGSVAMKKFILFVVAVEIVICILAAITVAII